MDLVFFRRVPIDFNGEKKIFRPFFMLLLVEGEEKECLPKFGVLIFILAHEIKQFYSLSWKHCIHVVLNSITNIFDSSYVLICNSRNYLPCRQ